MIYDNLKKRLLTLPIHLSIIEQSSCKLLTKIAIDIKIKLKAITGCRWSRRIFSVLNTSIIPVDKYRQLTICLVFWCLFIILKDYENTFFRSYIHYVRQLLPCVNHRRSHSIKQFTCIVASDLVVGRLFCTAYFVYRCLYNSSRCYFGILASATIRFKLQRLWMKSSIRACRHERHRTRISH